jgi:hypothetical protein
LANLIFWDSMPLQAVKKLTGVSKSAMSRRNQPFKDQLFPIVFSKVGYLWVYLLFVLLNQFNFNLLYCSSIHFPFLFNRKKLNIKNAS